MDDQARRAFEFIRDDAEMQKFYKNFLLFSADDNHKIDMIFYEISELVKCQKIYPEHNPLLEKFEKKIWWYSTVFPDY